MPHDKIMININFIRAQARRLNDLSESVYDVGNDKMSGRLKCVSEGLHEAADVISDSLNEIIIEYHDASVQASVNLMNGVLAGLEMGKTTTDPAE